MVHNRNHDKADLLQNTTWETSTSCETSRGVLHAHLVYTRLDGAGWEPCDCRTQQPFLQAQPEGITQSRATHRKWPMEMEGGTETMLGLRKDYSCNLRIHTCFVCKDKWETNMQSSYTLLQTQTPARSQQAAVEITQFSPQKGEVWYYFILGTIY